METVLTESEPKRILLIEEHPFVREALQSALQAFGHTVISLDSAKEGWVALSKEKFGVIVCSQHLPGISGMEFFIQTRRTSPHSLTILTAGFADNYLANDSLSLGIDIFMEKPFKIENLLACIQGRYPEIDGSSLDGCHYITGGGQIIAISPGPEHHLHKSKPFLEIPIERRGRQWKLYVNPDKLESSLRPGAADVGMVRQGI